MSENDIELDYGYLTQKALRGVIRDVLTITRDLGDVPGEHHYYIEFLTHAPGVSISKDLTEAYPERMTIVLQHKFEDLVVEEDHFEVTLHFKGVPDHLVIPYGAITAFVDPSVEFKLRFEPLTGEEDQAEDAEAEAPQKPEAQAEEAAADKDRNDDDEPPEGGADVVSLDAFRKK